MVDKNGNGTEGKVRGIPAIDRTRTGRVVSGLKKVTKTVIGILDKAGQHSKGAPQQSTAKHQQQRLAAEVARVKHFQSLLKSSAFFADDKCTFTDKPGDLTNELHPVFRKANFEDGDHHEVLLPTLRLATRLLNHPAARRLMRTIVTHRPTKIGEFDGDRKPLHEYPDDGRVLLTRQQEIMVDAALAELADMVKFVPETSLLRGHGTTDADPERVLNGKSTHLPGTCSTTRYSRQHYLHQKEILGKPPAEYDAPLIMAWQFQLALEFGHEVCHALFIARCGNETEGDTDIFFRNDALAEIGFAMEDRLLGGHLSMLYEEDDADDKQCVRRHRRANGRSSRFVGVMVLWDWPCVAVKNLYLHHNLGLWARQSGPQMTKKRDIGWRIPLSWLEPFFTTALWEQVDPDLHFPREVGRAFKVDSTGQRALVALTTDEQKQLLPPDYYVRGNGDIVLDT